MKSEKGFICPNCEKPFNYPIFSKPGSSSCPHCLWTISTWEWGLFSIYSQTRQITELIFSIKKQDELL